MAIKKNLIDNCHVNAINPAALIITNDKDDDNNTTILLAYAERHFQQQHLRSQFYSEILEFELKIETCHVLGPFIFSYSLKNRN